MLTFKQRRLTFLFVVEKGIKKETTLFNPNSDSLLLHALLGYLNCGSHRSWTPSALFALRILESNKILHGIKEKTIELAEIR